MIEVDRLGNGKLRRPTRENVHPLARIDLDLRPSPATARSARAHPNPRLLVVRRHVVNAGAKVDRTRWACRPGSCTSRSSACWTVRNSRPLVKFKLREVRVAAHIEAGAACFCPACTPRVWRQLDGRQDRPGLARRSRGSGPPWSRRPSQSGCPRPRAAVRSPPKDRCRSAPTPARCPAKPPERRCRLRLECSSTARAPTGTATARKTQAKKLVRSTSQATRAGF